MRHRHPYTALGLALLLAVGALCVVPVLRAQRDFARIYVTVVGSDNRPLSGLTAADFTVTEGGEVKSVSAADTATTPMVVELITDRLGGIPMFPPDVMRAALGAIAHTILEVLPGSRIGIMTFDGQAIQQVKFTSSQVTLTAAIKKLFSNNSAPVLLDAIMDAADALRSVPEERRAIVAIVADYKADLSSVQPTSVTRSLRRSRASLWMLEASSGAGTASSTNRDAMAMMVTKNSGGTAMTVASGSAIENEATSIAVLMLGQYVVTYAAPSTKDVPLDISVKRAGARVIGPHWTAQ